MQTLRPSTAGADRQAIAASQLAAEAALREIRAGFDGTLVLLKGLELSCRYLDPTDRPFGDIDLLTDEPDRLQATLIGLGYDPTSLASYDELHHDVPLRHPRLPVVVEVHRSLGWIVGMTPPSLETILTMTIPTAIGLEGLEALEPPAHAVYLAVHSWRHCPFWRPQDLDDIALLVDDEGVSNEAAQLAHYWGVSRIWSYYRNAIAVRSGEQRPKGVVRLFGGGSSKVVSRSGRSADLARAAGWFFVDHPVRNMPDIVQQFRQQLQPRSGETRRDMARRILARLT